MRHATHISQIVKISHFHALTLGHHMMSLKIHVIKIYGILIHSHSYNVHFY